ncbi:Mitochondrial inner membrane protein oxa1l [Saguinus oedipus]|uniref:Mitochondrial inner membrane protein oxa1l n=1 Tax=Saguinus oedipus TaxID=9490 RepID=A0ABQ9V3J9_SAGOE|nr:Mitochondrial inner membrane protein oxa1l [Saguinus oedipus]
MVQAPPVVPATPSPTAVPEVASGETADIVQAAAETSFTELGLEFCKATSEQGTVLARCLIFPVIVKGQREAVKNQNHMPEIQKFTARIREARLAGDHTEFYRASAEMSIYQKKHGISFFKPLILPLTQAPIFISFFLALREMANLPVPSLQTGGLWWFQDLTVSDPIFVLPVVVTATMSVVLEAVFIYWLSSNLFSLVQVSCLRIPAVRTVLKIPQRVVHNPDNLAPREGFLQSFKRGWKNAELMQQLQERERRMRNHLDLAAKGPLRQTFTHNPLLQPVKNNPPSTPSSSTRSTSKPKSKYPWRDTLG